MILTIDMARLSIGKHEHYGDGGRYLIDARQSRRAAEKRTDSGKTLVCEENRNARVEQDVDGDAAEERLANPAMSEAADHQHVRLRSPRVCDQNFVNRVPVGLQIGRGAGDSAKLQIGVEIAEV
jgi:hypothetical protein